MTDLRDLYQELILDHGKSPRNFRRIERPSRKAAGFNPLCGDQLELFLTLDDAGRVLDAAFVGKGCAISTSSTSLMTQLVKGKTPAEAKALFQQFHALVTGEGPCDEERMGKLTVFKGVRDYPNRVKCATLAWHTLLAALDQQQDPVSTE